MKLIEHTTVHISDDTGRIAMREVLNPEFGSDGSEAELTRYVYSNHLQSASLELNEEAEVISYEEYHPYGTTAYQAYSSAINATAKRYRYTGKERDEESGLYYHGARYYVPWLGRWCAADPLEGERAGLSPYDYCSNNPVMKIDPNGMLDGWVDVDGKMINDSRAFDANSTAKIYGDKAIFRENGYSYESNKGHHIELKELGYFRLDGEWKYSPDQKKVDEEKRQEEFPGAMKDLLEKLAIIAEVSSHLKIMAGVLKVISDVKVHYLSRKIEVKEKELDGLIEKKEFKGLSKNDAVGPNNFSGGGASSQWGPPQEIKTKEDVAINLLKEIEKLKSEKESYKTASDYFSEFTKSGKVSQEVVDLIKLYKDPTSDNIRDYLVKKVNDKIFEEYEKLKKNQK